MHPKNNRPRKGLIFVHLLGYSWIITLHFKVESESACNWKDWLFFAVLKWMPFCLAARLKQIKENIRIQKDCLDTDRLIPGR